jgi:mediator of RNA polymerase II transcription subunit 12
MTELFCDLTDLTENTLRTLLHNAGEALHLMSSILQPLRVNTAGLPTLEPDVQDAFLSSTHAATKRLDEVITAGEVSENIPDLVVIVARLWQFDLCLPGAWTAKFREIVGDVLTTVVQLAIVSEMRTCWIFISKTMVVEL